VRGDFVGVDAEEYPRDFAAMVRYHSEIGKNISSRYPSSCPLRIDQFDEFFKRNKHRLKSAMAEAGAR
jgi:hypothetical protein